MRIGAPLLAHRDVGWQVSVESPITTSLPRPTVTAAPTQEPTKFATPTPTPTPASAPAALSADTTALALLTTLPIKGKAPMYDPNYAGACVPIDSDMDCAGGSGNCPSYVRGPVTVIGVDNYDLDGDGIAC